VAAVVLVTVAAAFGVVYRYTRSQLYAQLDTSIRDDSIQLAKALTERRHATVAGLLTTAKHYAAAQPFGQSSALLFVLIPGVGTASNHQELFGYSRPDDNETAAEQAVENAYGKRLATPHIGYQTVTAPDVGSLRIYQVPVRAAGRIVYSGAGESLDAIDRAEDGVQRSFLLAGGLALILAVLAASVIGSRISAPMRRIAGVAARVDEGELTPRMDVPETATRELRVLADAFNHMLDRLEQAFAAQREFVADASHELRTPLTVIRGQLDLLAADGGAPDPAELRRVERMIQSEVSRLTRLVGDMLLLAQTDRDDFLHLTDVPLAEFVQELWDGLSLTAERNFEVGALPAVTIRADPDRLAQALRNLASNAVAHTRAPDGLVRIDVEPLDSRTVRLAVTDDGPGIPPAERERVFERFHRANPARTREDGGAGLGLSIVRAIVGAHHGTVRVLEGEGGGARFEVELPRPSRSASVPAGSMTGRGLPGGRDD
jgi:two-component system, OmpR family, sensor kinase